MLAVDVNFGTAGEECARRHQSRSALVGVNIVFRRD
jgi:hypothetical protein